MELHIREASPCIQFFCDLYQPLFRQLPGTEPPPAGFSLFPPSVRGEIKFSCKWNIHFHSATDGHLNLKQLFDATSRHCFASWNTFPLMSLPSPTVPSSRGWSRSERPFGCDFVKSRIPKKLYSLLQSLEICLSHFRWDVRTDPRRGGTWGACEWRVHSL